MAKITFTKVVGSGNDFIIFDNRDRKIEKDISDFSAFAKEVCARRISIGADGVLILENSKKADFKMRIFNPDGSEVTMCGNGARCSALFAYKKGWCKDKLKIETGAGILEAFVSTNRVKLRMTEPAKIQIDKDLGISNTIFKAHIINSGVPHAVHFLQEEKELDFYPVKQIGEKIRYHKFFEPEGTNVNFVKVLSSNKIKLRTYERGVEDETLACGTGAVASAIISHLVNGTEQPVDVLTKSEDILRVYFSDVNKKIKDVYLEGPARVVYEGTLEL